MTTHATEDARSARSLYTPTSDQMLDPRWWRRRIGLLVLLSGLVSGTMGAVGARIAWPWDDVRPLARQVVQQGRAIDSARLRVDSLERGSRTDRYLLCQVLRRVSPPGAVIPEECSPRLAK